MSDRSVLSAIDVCVSYGAVQAVRGCTLHVAPDEAVAIVGANGAGKTTLLRALSNMMSPTSGTITYCGGNVGPAPVHRLAYRGLLHIPEGRGVLGSLSVQENLRIAHEVRPTHRSFADAAADVYAHFPRLAERRGQRAGDLSGGEQQMLALARAIVNAPKIVLIDEPSLGLSPVMVKEAYRILRLLKGRGMSILLVEQNVKMALRFSDRAYVMKQGKIILEGASRDLLTDQTLLHHYLGAD